MGNEQKNIKNFYAPGKLLISGEYLVLRGAQALAVPLKFGQSLRVETHEGENRLRWEAYLPDRKWFSALFNTENFEYLQSDNQELTLRLQSIFREIRKLNPNFLKKPAETLISTTLSFNPEWGTGSSSSLMANMAKWAEIDPFELNKRIFGGSGYDIASVITGKSIIYRLINEQPDYHITDFAPPFSENLYFVYQNRKQKSRTAIEGFSNTPVSDEELSAISKITLKMISTDCLSEFSALMDEHEQIVAKILKQTPVKQLLFQDFNGSIKSLGAWGGDFLLAASGQKHEYVMDYFSQKGFKTIISWKDMVAGEVISSRS